MAAYSPLTAALPAEPLPYGGGGSDGGAAGDPTAGLMPMADACAVSPALRAWVECLVDTRVDHSARDGELAAVLDRLRREVNAEVSMRLAAVGQEAELGRQRSDAQLRSLADAQAQLVSVVEGLSCDAERYDTAAGRVRADAAQGLDRVTGAMEQLQLAVQRDGEATGSRLRQLEADLRELERALAEEVGRRRAACSELGQLQQDSLAELRRAAASAVDARLAEELAAWSAERRACEGRCAELRADLDARGEEQAGQLAALRAELGRRAEALRAADEQLAERLEDARQALAQQLSAAQSSLSQRLSNLQQAAMQDIEASSQNLETLREDLKDLREMQDCLRTEVSDAVREDMQELRTRDLLQEQRWEQVPKVARAEALKEIISLQLPSRELIDGLDEGFRDALDQCAHLQEAQQRAEVELATLRATREVFELRAREAHEELRLALDAFRCELHEALDAQSVDPGAAELVQEREQELRRQVAALPSKLGAEVEALRSDFERDLALLRRQLSGELRGELRSFHKQAQAAVEQVDEQLWRTDSELGRRVDELAQAFAASEFAAGRSAAWRRGPAPAAPAGLPRPVDVGRAVAAAVAAEPVGRHGPGGPCAEQPCPPLPPSRGALHAGSPLKMAAQAARALRSHAEGVDIRAHDASAD